LPQRHRVRREGCKNKYLFGFVSARKPLQPHWLTRCAVLLTKANILVKPFLKWHSYFYARHFLKIFSAAYPEDILPLKFISIFTINKANLVRVGLGRVVVMN